MCIFYLISIFIFKKNPLYRANSWPNKEGINCLVHLAGIEPVRVASLDPKSSASASSAIGALVPSIGIEPTT